MSDYVMSNYGRNWGWKDAYRAIGWRGVLGILVRWFDTPIRGYSPYYWVTGLDVSEETEPGWYRFHWRPIRGSTFGNYVLKTGDGCWIPKTKVYNSSGYNYCNKSRYFHLRWLKWEFTFWIHWDFHMGPNGPVDWSEPTKPRLKGVLR